MGLVLVIQLVGTVMSLGMEQLLQTRFGALGVLGLFLIAVGVRARNSTCASVGAVILVLLMAQA